MSAHTPGPWASHWPNNTGLKAGVWSGNGEIQIARCDSGALSIEGNRANARLISAAPELLDALQDLVALLPDPELDQDDVQRGFVEKARAVIARATGEQA